MLDEAIAKAKEDEDWQLVEWLRMARGGENAAKWYTTKLDQLKAENTKLRAERDYILANSNPTAAELHRVRSAWKKDRDENAKLRELCVDMRKALIHGNCYRWCEFNGTCDGKCQYIDRMRELGVLHAKE